MNGFKDQKRKCLKILFLIPYFIPAWRFGGPVQLSYTIASKLIQKGHEITVLTTDVFKPNERINEKYNIIEGIRIFYFKNWSNYIAAKYKISQPRRLKRFLKREIHKYDIIHIQEFYSIMTYWAFKYAKEEKKPLFINLNGVLSEYPQKNKRFLKKLFNILLKKTILNAKGIIVQTENEKKDAEKFHLKNILLLNVGIDLKNFNNLPIRNIFRDKYKLKDDEIAILFLARIAEIKGLKYLIEAIHKINSSKYRLFIIGPDDNYLNNVFKNIKKFNLENQIRIIGWVSNEEKLEAYAGSDIYCLPSLYDCAPITILEASACRIPIITTITNGLNDIALKGAGICVKPRDSDDLKKAILNLTRAKNKMIEMGNIGRSIVEKEYDWNIIIEKLEDYYYLSLKSIDN